MEPDNTPKPADIEYCLDIVDRMLSGRHVPVNQMVDLYQSRDKGSEPPTARERPQVRQSLAENFLGASSSEIEEAIAQITI